MSPSSKSSTRTPPFVLVGLVLLVLILGYNYWSMSLSHRSLRKLNDEMAIEAKDVAEKRASAETKLQSAIEELKLMTSNYEKSKKEIADKETELNNLRAEHNKILSENKMCKESLAKCDENLQTEKKNSESLTAQKTKLEEDLKAKEKEVKPTQCSAEPCKTDLKNSLVVASKLIGTENLSKALTEAKLDASKLMEGIEKVDPPGVAKNQTKP